MQEDAWFKAADDGDEKLMAKLLAEQPNLLTSVDAVHDTALHIAATHGWDKVVALLLAANPELATQVDYSGHTAFRYAIIKGHEKVFGQLLAAWPEVVNTYGKSLLLCAVSCGQTQMAAQLLAVRPNFLAIGADGFNPVHDAVFKGHPKLAEWFLEIKPEFVFGVTKEGSTVLHCAISGESVGIDFIAKLWRMNPQALRAVDQDARTPFHLVVTQRESMLLELFEWSVPLDDLVGALCEQQTKPHRIDGNRYWHLSSEVVPSRGTFSSDQLTWTKFNGPVIDWRVRYGPVVSAECESLWTLLNQDVVSIVFDYLELDLTKCHPQQHKRTKKSNLSL